MTRKPGLVDVECRSCRPDRNSIGFGAARPSTSGWSRRPPSAGHVPRRQHRPRPARLTQRIAPPGNATSHQLSSMCRRLMAIKRQGLRPRQPRDRRPRGQRDRDDGVLKPRPQRRHEDQRQERQEDIGDPHQHRVEPRAEMPCQRSDREPDRPNDHRHQRDDRQRDSRAADDPAEHVAPTSPVAKKCAPDGGCCTACRFCR
jgi:hypothetical protein